LEAETLDRGRGQQVLARRKSLHRGCGFEDEMWGLMPSRQASPSGATRPCKSQRSYPLAKRLALLQGAAWATRAARVGSVLEGAPNARPFGFGLL
jgi:hypothetical protein